MSLEQEIDSMSGADRRSLWMEKLESRRCLSTTAFAERPIVGDEIAEESSILLADFDGDGDADALSRSSSPTGQMGWYENLDGGGTFGSQRTIAVGFEAGTAVASDLDGDGDIDIVASGYNEAIAWFENLDGKGGFGEARIIVDFAVGFVAIATGDVDQDGDLDLASVSDAMLVWHENLNGSGKFRQHMISSGVSLTPQTLGVADLDGDSDLDVIAAQSDTIVWHENVDARGRFSEPIELTNFDSAHVVASDVNGDGDIDIVAFSPFEAIVIWLENEGQGQFTGAKQPIATATAAASASVTDVDTDGDLDVLLGDANRFDWHENRDGQGNFGLGGMIDGQTRGTHLAVAGDIDGDGDPDALSVLSVASSSERQLRWHENEGEGRFALRDAIATTGLIGARLAMPADLDGDGDADILAAGSRDGTDNHLVWFENLGGAFSDRREIDSANPMSVWSLDAADVDGDGDLDVLVHSYSSVGLDEQIAIHWIENVDGRGSFGDRKSIFSASGSPAGEIVALDVDGDGNIDVVSARADEFWWHKNPAGQGQRWTTQVLAQSFSGTIVRAMAVDLDGNNEADLLYATEEFVGWLQNHGEAGFEGRLISGRGNATIASADLDGDQDPDVLIGAGGAVIWYRNLDGQGTFELAEALRDPLDLERALGIDAGDLDRDGDMDLVAEYGGQIFWYENLGDAFATPRQLPAVASHLTSLTTADLDRDGRFDILMSSDLDGRLTWYASRLIGDSNQDGIFDSSDLIQVLQFGRYNDQIPNNATYDEGDWNGDGDFDSGDLVLAFQAGTYVANAGGLNIHPGAADRFFAQTQLDDLALHTALKT